MQQPSPALDDVLVGLLREHGTLTAVEAGAYAGLDRTIVRSALDRLRRRGVVEFRSTIARNRSWGDGGSAGIWTLRD
jgi:predicted ArsR family transcriptional regulator